MARYTAEHLIEISEKMWASKMNWDDLLAECYEHAASGKNPYYENGTGQPTGAAIAKGQDKTSKRVYDSTVMTDAQKLQNRIQTEVFPIGSEWADLEAGAFVQDENRDKARAELEALQKTLFMVIQISNFDLAIAEWLLDLIVAGTACMLVSQGNDQYPIVYQTVPQSHVALREGAFGFIDAISRKYRMRMSVVPQTWKDAKPVPMPQEDNAKKQDPEIDLVEVTYLDHVEMIWRYDVMVIGGDGKVTADHTRIVDRDYQVNPWSIARWSKAAGEAQGRSLVMAALPDARVLSSVKKYLLQQAALSIGGVFLVRNDGVINANSVRIFPGATIPVKSTGGGNTGASIAPLNVGGDLNMAQIMLQDLVNSIHRTMLNDGTPDMQDGVRSATEWIERMRQLQQDIGAPIARILKEGVVPMLESTLQVLGEMKIIELPERGSLKLNGGEIKVNFNSPLVQQQSLREVEDLVNAANTTRQVAGQSAEQILNLTYKMEDVGNWIGQKFGVLPKVMRSAQERQQLQQQAGQLAAQQAQEQNAPTVGGNGGVAPQQIAA